MPAPAADRRTLRHRCGLAGGELTQCELVSRLARGHPTIKAPSCGATGLACRVLSRRAGTAGQPRSSPDLKQTGQPLDMRVVLRMPSVLLANTARRLPSVSPSLFQRWEIFSALWATRLHGISSPLLNAMPEEFAEHADPRLAVPAVVETPMSAEAITRRSGMRVIGPSCSRTRQISAILIIISPTIPWTPWTWIFWRSVRSSSAALTIWPGYIADETANAIKYFATRRVIAEGFDRLDYRRLASVYCYEGGDEFWKSKRGAAPCRRLGTRIRILAHAARSRWTRSVGAGVSRFCPAVESLDLHRGTLLPCNLRRSEVATLNRACRGLPPDFMR